MVQKYNQRPRVQGGSTPNKSSTESTKVTVSNSQCKLVVIDLLVDGPQVVEYEDNEMEVDPKLRESQREEDWRKIRMQQI
jgi:hypothetical protein